MDAGDDEQGKPDTEKRRSIPYLSLFAANTMIMGWIRSAASGILLETCESVL